MQYLTCRRSIVRVLASLAGLSFLISGGASQYAAEFETLIFGGEASYPPFEWLDNGKPTGLNVDLQLAIAEVGGVRAVHRLGDWSEVIRDLKSGAVDVVAMFPSESRERDFLFTQPFSFINHAIYGRNDAPNINSIGDLSASVAVEELSYAHERLLDEGVSARLVLTPNTIDALTAVVEGRAEYVILSEPAGDYLIRAGNMPLHPIGSPLWPAEYAFAVHKDRPELARWLDVQMDVVEESGLYREIRYRWESVSTRQPSTFPWLGVGVFPLMVLVLLGSFWVWSLRRKLADQAHKLLGEAELREKAESRLVWAEDHNADTGVPKQHHFMRAATRLLQRQDRKQVVAVLKLADLDQTIRARGHDAGLEMVRQFAAGIQAAGFPAFGQIGRDVFAILGEKTQIDSEFRTLIVDGETAVMKASYPRIFAGAATCPQHGDTVPELLRKAEAALSIAIERRNAWVDFRRAMEPNEVQLELVALFRERGASVIYPMFQPQVDLRTGEVVGAEALARWEVSGIGQVSPAVFIPLLDHAGLMLPVTRRMVTEAVRVAADLRNQGCACPISVNVTGNDLLGWKLSRDIFAAVQKFRGSPADLKLELTETGVVDRPAVLQWKMRRLVKNGIDISVDDFGTGYSSLAYLSDFPVREIKIDQSFVRDMVREDKDMRIVASTISMGHELGLTVVAEGVETEETLNVLRRFGCDRAQGYVISRPLRESDFIDYVTRNAGLRQSTSRKVTRLVRRT